MQVREMMTESPASCTPNTNLQAVARMMGENDCGAIPVVENQQTMKPVGMITDRDITCRTVAAGKMDACNVFVEVKQAITQRAAPSEPPTLATYIGSLRNDQIPSGCAADLIAVAEALQ